MFSPEVMAIISLLVLIGTIAIGFIKKINIGLLSFGVALVVGSMAGMTQKQIVKGFNTGLFVILIGAMLLFTIAQLNGTIDVLAKKMVRLAGKRLWAVVIAMYILGFVVAILGPGTIPGFGVAAMFGVPLALALKMDPFLLSVVGQMGAIAGGIVPWAPTGAIGVNLAAKGGIHDLALPLFINITAGTIFVSIILFIVFKGWKSHNNDGKLESVKEVPKFTKVHIITLLSLLLMVVSVIALKVNIGLVSFLIAGVLLLCGFADAKKCVSSMPWNTLLLVTGVGVLMNVVISTGGIKLLAELLSSVMTDFLAPGLISLAAGVMSWFSSTSGVVMPTLIPTVPDILANLGDKVQPALMVSALVLGSSVAGISPASTGGALSMAALSSEYDNQGLEYNYNKLFIKLFLTSILAVMLASLFALVGYGFTPY